MITDDERREVAARLREYASWDEDGDLVGCTEFGESVLNLLDGETERECFNALADLIEPTPKVNRVALLALADEMYRDGKMQRDRVRAGIHWFVDGLDVMDYARRIREALGAER